MSSISNYNQSLNGYVMTDNEIVDFIGLPQCTNDYHELFKS